MMHKGYTWMVLVCLSLIGIDNHKLFAQDQKGYAFLTTRLSKDTILIGDQVEFTLELLLDKQQQQFIYLWPVFGDSLSGHVEIVSREEVDSTFSGLNKDTLRIAQKFIITCFEEGFKLVPGMAFCPILSRTGDTLAKQQIKPTLLLVDSIKIPDSLILPLPANAQDSIDFPSKIDKRIKDIKPVYDTPFIFAEIKTVVVWGAVILLAIAAFIIALIFFLKNGKKNYTTIQASIPEDIEAIEKLLKVETEALWQKGKIKEYYSDVTEILRIYIEKRFKVSALEQTTFEIMRNLQLTPIPFEQKEQLKIILEIADLVKFAKANPVSQENEIVIRYAKEFVELTKKPREEVKA